VLYVCGLTTDYCVKETALDALREGFHTCVVTDAVAAVNLQPGDDKKALQEMYAAGCILVESGEIL
jgi:nicotinamidase/pyrazinamidase